MNSRQTGTGTRTQRKRLTLIPDEMLDAHARLFPEAFDRDNTLALYAIRSVAQRMNDHANEWLAEFGLNAAKYQYLAQLYFSGGELTLNALSTRVHTSNAAVTAMINALQSELLVKRVPNPLDRRSAVAHITPKGRRVFERALPAQYANSARGMAKLSRDERRLLTSLLGRVAAGFEEAFEHGASEDDAC